MSTNMASSALKICPINLNVEIHKGSKDGVFDL